MRLWKYQALTVDNSADRTEGKVRSSYGPLNPAGSGRQPSGIKQENQQSVARCNLRNQANRLSRPCVELERAVILHGAVEGKKNRKAYLRGILPCSETSPAYSSALSAKSPYV